MTDEDVRTLLGIVAGALFGSGITLAIAVRWIVPLDNPTRSEQMKSKLLNIDASNNNAITAETGTDHWECDARAVAFKIIPLLHGMPLNQARYALQTAETWLLQTHKVDANNAELIAGASAWRESKDANSAPEGTVLNSAPLK
jgi:hypothetical protein